MIRVLPFPSVINARPRAVVASESRAFPEMKCVRARTLLLFYFHERRRGYTQERYSELSRGESLSNVEPEHSRVLRAFTIRASTSFGFTKSLIFVFLFINNSCAFLLISMSRYNTTLHVYKNVHFH